MLRRVLVLILALWIFVRPGNGCSPDPANDVFIQVHGPDAPYARYANGHLGVVEKTYRVRHLVVAYNYLAGRALTPGEQKGAIAVNALFGSGGSDDDSLSGVVSREVPGQSYREEFPNCLRDAFQHADDTLAQRKREHGEQNPEVVEWSRGQAAVFSNCSGPGVLPEPVPHASLWLQQDRAYQIAAAKFYAVDYDGALADFKAIAADHASPWSSLARYMVARVLIRRGVVLYSFPANDLSKLHDADQRVLGDLGAAKAQLEGILRDPGMKPMQEASRRLLDYVEARYEPQRQQGVLTRRLSTPASEAVYTQSVIDLSRIRAGSLNSFWLAHAEGRKTTQEHSSMLEWVDALNAEDGKEKALARWRSGHEPVWLVAAMTLAAPGDEAVPQLIAAAKEIPTDSPAYATVTYHRLRLSGTEAGIFDELTRLMPGIEKTESRSTINRFADLEQVGAPSLEGFLRSVPVLAASLSYDADPEGISLQGGDAWYRTPVGDLCGVSTVAPGSRHFDPQAAVILNQRMPLRLLRDAALSSELPKNLQFEVAHVAWTRAVLLDDAETARALSPVLAGCQPAFKPWLDRYDAAKTSDERHVAGLFALMRFTSTEPVVRWGVQRDFAAYDDFRDNWWCGSSKQDDQGDPARSIAADPGNPAAKATLFGSPIVPEQEQPSPAFLSAQDKADAAREIARLMKIPGAPDYFATQALSWYKEHPADSRNADLLGFAKRVVRNGCRTAETTELDHQLFTLLQRRYPNSEWAKKYPSWE